MASHNWIFTLNNPDIQFEAIWRPDKMKFLVGQLEKGENGTMHYQGYFRLIKRTRFGGVKKLVPQAHLEPRKGTHTQAYDYCTKEDTREGGPWEIGTPPRPGARTDLEELALMVKDGASDRQLFEEHPASFVRYYRGLREARQVLRDTTPTQTKGIYLHGPTGCGKSTHLLQQYPGADWVTFDGKFHSGYTGAKVVIYDDVDISLMSRSLKLQLVNKTPRRIRCFGSMKLFNPELVIIVSNHPYSVFCNGDPAVERRYVDTPH